MLIWRNMAQDLRDIQTRDTNKSLLFIILNQY